MQIPNNKLVVCITARVWSGSSDAPRRMLVKDGFLRPTWFTTGRPITDAEYRRTSAGEFHKAMLEEKVLAHIEYGGSHVGILADDFESAMSASQKGVLVVAPPEIAAQLAAAIPQAKIFSIKDAEMDPYAALNAAEQTGQLHRIDVDVLEPGAWRQVYVSMTEIMGLPTETDPF